MIGHLRWQWIHPPSPFAGSDVLPSNPLSREGNDATSWDLINRRSSKSALSVLKCPVRVEMRYSCGRSSTGLRRITLHDSRHTTLTLMEHAGVPISIISKWAGHYDSAFTQKTYVHASGEDLQRGQAALARIHKIA
jgi:integrase